MNNRYKILILTLLGILLTIPTNLAQEKLNDKIENIEGPVQKIVITADGQDYTFQGNEAKQLFDKIKKKSSHNFVWTTSDSADGKEKVYIIRTDGDDKDIEIESEGENKIIIKSDKDLDDLDNIKGIKKKVIVEVENGNKKVTVTTTENGEEKTEVYEGKEVDEYIDKMKANDEDLNIIIEYGKDKKKVKKIIIETEKEEKNKSNSLLHT
ncbi:MAG: hypothetical protein P8X47_03755 [Ignavibacteriaceae bacterium]